MWKMLTKTCSFPFHYRSASLQTAQYSSLVAPAAPSEKSYRELVQAMKDHHSPPPLEIIQR